MQLSLHLGFFRLSLSVSRERGFSWGRLTIRQNMVLIFVLAMFIFICLQWIKSQSAMVIVRTYSIGHLIGRTDIDRRFSSLSGIAEAFRRDAHGDTWADKPRRITPFETNQTLIVTDSRRGQELFRNYWKKFQ